jgi:hypothetical protein
MTDIDPAKTTKRPTPMLIVAARDHAQEGPLEGRTHCALAFGIAGAKSSRPRDRHMPALLMSALLKQLRKRLNGTLDARLQICRDC